MKHLSKFLPKLLAVGAIALSMSSCNRAEYAMLPKTTPYHGTSYTTPKPAPAPAVANEEVAQTEAATLEATEKNVAVTAPVAEAPAVAVAPKAAQPAPAAKAAQAVPTAAPAAAPRKLNLVERVALNKVAKKMDKLTSKVQIKQRGEAADANALSGNLRTGVILILVGLLISLLSFISGIFGVIGGIIAIIGLIFIILYLLDEV